MGYAMTCAPGALYKIILLEFCLYSSLYSHFFIVCFFLMIWTYDFTINLDVFGKRLVYRVLEVD